MLRWRDRRGRSQLRSRAARLEEAQALIQSVEYRFVTLDDISSLVSVLAGMCPVPDVAPGLSDLMVNAVEHGNLGVTYQEKSLLKWEGDWEAEIKRRLALPSSLGVLPWCGPSAVQPRSPSRSPTRARDSNGKVPDLRSRIAPSTRTVAASPWPG